MFFDKPATTIDDQISLLKDRGMAGGEGLMCRWLETVEYYRLSASWLPFEVYPPAGATRSKVFPLCSQFADIVGV